MPDSAPPSQRLPSVSRIRVLHVEDDPDTARLISRRLAHSRTPRFDVVHVPDLGSALGHVERQGCDVLLLDLGLPDGDGPGTIADACALARHVPIVVLTSCDDDGLADYALQAGASAYLLKGDPDLLGLPRTLARALEIGPAIARDARRWF